MRNAGKQETEDHEMGIAKKMGHFTRIAGVDLYNYPRLVNARLAKILKTSGIVIIISSLALLPLDGLRLHHLRAQPDYHDPTDGEREVLATYLCIIIGIGAGCVFLWVASRFNKNR